MKQLKYKEAVFFQVKMTMSNGEIRHARVRGKIAKLTRDVAAIYMGFEGTHGYGVNGHSLVFGELMYLHSIKCDMIVPIQKVELVPVTNILR